MYCTYTPAVVQYVAPVVQYVDHVLQYEVTIVYLHVLDVRVVQYTILCSACIPCTAV